MNSFKATETFVPRGTPLPAQMTGEEFSEHYRVLWAMFFSSVYGFQQHPGMNRENARAKTIGECAEIADKMLLEMTYRMRNGI
jgi:hypothetical protein